MSRQFKKHFPVFACEGDRITVDLSGGWHAIATIHRDTDSGPPDKMSDGFWPSLDKNSAGYIGPKSKRTLERQTARAKEVMRAWEADEWFYCGVGVDVYKGDVCLSNNFQHSRWGIDCNYPKHGNWRPNRYLLEVANELLTEAVTAARPSR